MDLVDLLSRGGLSCSDCPHWLIGQNDVLPTVNWILYGIKLPFDNFDCFVGFPLSKGFSEAEDNLNPIFQSILNFFCYSDILFCKMSPSFAVAEDNPFDIYILELISGNFSSESSEAISRTILCSHLNMLILFGKHDCDEVEEDGCDDNV